MSGQRAKRMHIAGRYMKVYVCVGGFNNYTPGAIDTCVICFIALRKQPSGASIEQRGAHLLDVRALYDFLTIFGKFHAVLLMCQ